MHLLYSFVYISEKSGLSFPRSTYFRRSKNCHVGFVVNFMRFPAVKKIKDRLPLDNVRAKIKVARFMTHGV